MENLSAPEPRYTVLCPEHMLFDMQNGTWFVETVRASGQVIRANSPDTRPHLTKQHSHQKCLAKQAPSTQDKAELQTRLSNDRFQWSHFAPQFALPEASLRCSIRRSVGGQPVVVPNYGPYSG